MCWIVITLCCLGTKEALCFVNSASYWSPNGKNRPFCDHSLVRKTHVQRGILLYMLQNLSYKWYIYIWMIDLCCMWLLYTPMGVALGLFSCGNHIKNSWFFTMMEPTVRPYSVLPGTHRYILHHIQYITYIEWLWNTFSKKNHLRPFSESPSRGPMSQNGPFSYFLRSKNKLCWKNKAQGASRACLGPPTYVIEGELAHFASIYSFRQISTGSHK